MLQVSMWSLLLKKNLFLYIFTANNHEQFYLMFYMGYSDD